MKLKIVILMLLIPLLLTAQERKRFALSDTVIPVNKILKKEFKGEKLKQIEQMESLKDSPYSFGILEIENILALGEGNSKMYGQKILSSCQCHMILDTIEIANAFGFQSGVASIIKIHLPDSNFQSVLYHITDGVKEHKHNEGEEFIEDIVVELNDEYLEISPDSEFRHNGIIKGKLIGTSKNYYERDVTASGYKKVQTRVLSVFKCKLLDFTKEATEYERKRKLNKTEFPSDSKEKKN